MICSAVPSLLTVHVTEQSRLYSKWRTIVYAPDGDDVSVLTLLELSSTFDTIDHNILLHRLQSLYGISGTVLSWFESCRTERTQTVIIHWSFGGKSVHSRISSLLRWSAWRFDSVFQVGHTGIRFPPKDTKEDCLSKWLSLLIWLTTKRYNILISLPLSLCLCLPPPPPTTHPFFHKSDYFVTDP